MGAFQLFPPPSPEGRVSTNPFRQEKKKQSADASPIPVGNLKNSGGTEGVVFQINEDTNNIQSPPRAHIAKSSSPAQESAPRSSSREKAWPERQESLSSVETWSTTLVNSSNRSFASPHSRDRSSPAPSRSPGLPMRSMFPRYDFNLPLSQQKYYPRSSNGPQTHSGPRGLTLSPASEIDRALGLKTAPASAMGLLGGNRDLDEIRYSSPAELKGLWEAANGQRPQDLPETFNLRVERTEAATFTFGDSQRPFYTLDTYSTNELCISRADPSKESTNTNIPIMMLCLEDRTRREPPNDGLVTDIFSRLAAMLAIEQASNLKEQHHLSPTEASKVEADALKRASAHESHRLSWDNGKRIYELKHTALLKQKHHQRPALVGAAGIALSPSPVQKQYSGILHLTVSSSQSEGDSSNGRSKPPTIAITIPTTSNSAEGSSGAASPRTSSLPLTDSDDPLASLDLATMTLSISALAILATIPSLYAIDTLIAALLAVAVSDEATNPVLSDMPTAEEKKSGCRSQYHSSPFRGKKLITTLAEREDHDFESDEEEEVDYGEQVSQSAAKPQKPARNPFSASFWTKPKRKRERNKIRKRKVVIEEFDLEKCGRYAPGSSREGKKLPAPVRGVLCLLFWTLDVVLRGMAAGVKVLAWVLVNGTRCVSSDKF